jgi:hypothetical protein
VNWWNENGENIKNELENHLPSISDENIRTHVRDNFTKRWHKMNAWSKAMSADHAPDEMYDINSLGDKHFNVYNSKQQSPKISSKFLESLPQKPKDALFAIYDIINKKGKVTDKQRNLLSSAIDNVISKMTPEEASDTFKHSLENPYMATKVIKNDHDFDPRLKMLKHFAEPISWSNNIPTYKNNHLIAMANTIDQLPPEKTETLRHWADHYRRLSQEGNERQAI